MSEEYAAAHRDWLHDKFVSSLLWGLPPFIMAATAFIELESPLRAVVWTGSLLVMSAGCFAKRDWLEISEGYASMGERA